jgi:hypothetical protein
VALNPKGFWRVLVVLYALFAVATVVGTGIAVSNALECPSGRAKDMAEHRRWEQLPMCTSVTREQHARASAGNVEDGRVVADDLVAQLEHRCKAQGSPFEPQIRSCDSVLSVIGIGLLVLVGGFGVMFGGGLVVRWVVRGFMPSPRIGP